MSEANALSMLLTLLLLLKRHEQSECHSFDFDAFGLLIFLKLLNAFNEPKRLLYKACRGHIAPFSLV
jgi:hypothetical protein